MKKTKSKNQQLVSWEPWHKSTPTSPGSAVSPTVLILFWLCALTPSRGQQGLRNSNLLLRQNKRGGGGEFSLISLLPMRKRNREMCQTRNSFKNLFFEMRKLSIFNFCFRFSLIKIENVMKCLYFKNQFNINNLFKTFTE